MSFNTSIMTANTPEIRRGRFIPTIEQQIEAYDRFFSVGQFMLEKANDCWQNVRFARDENLPEGLLGKELTVPSTISEKIDELHLWERYSYRMNVATSALVMRETEIKNEYGIITASNTKAGKGGYKRCSEDSALIVAERRDFQYMPGLILVGDPLDAETVEDVKTSTVWPCSKTCVRKTLKKSPVVFPSMLIITASSEGGLFQFLTLEDINAAYKSRSRSGVDDFPKYVDIDFDKVRQAFNTNLQETRLGSLSVARIAQLSLHDGARVALGA